jgi:hypothetical protein
MNETDLRTMTLGEGLDRAFKLYKSNNQTPPRRLTSSVLEKWFAVTPENGRMSAM